MKRLFRLLSILSILSVCLAANITWDGSESTSWSLGANWVGDVGPTNSDVAVFDGATSNNNCLVGDGFEVKGIEVESDYTGTIDLGDTDEWIDIGDEGLVCAGSGTFDCGDADIEILNGPLDYVDQGTWDADASSITFRGTGDWIAKEGGGLNDLEIDTAATTTVPAASAVAQVGGAFIVNGTFIIASGERVYCDGDVQVTLGASGRITGAYLRLQSLASGAGIVSFPGTATFDVATLSIGESCHAGAVIVAGTYDCDNVYLWNSNSSPTWTLSAGDYVFGGTNNGNLTFQNFNGSGTITLDASGAGRTITVKGNLVYDIDATGNIVVDNSGAAVNWVLEGDVVDEDTGGGTVTWTDGTGTIMASGTNAQNWDWAGATPGALVIEKSSGTLTLGDDLTCASYTQTDGTVDFNSKTLTTTGDLTLSAGADGLAANLPGCTLVVGGAFSAVGTSNASRLDMTAATSWTLTATNLSHAKYVDVSNSDASGGAKVIASKSTDSGSNSNWRFVTREWWKWRRRGIRRHKWR